MSKLINVMTLAAALIIPCSSMALAKGKVWSAADFAHCLTVRGGGALDSDTSISAVQCGNQLRQTVSGAKVASFAGLAWEKGSRAIGIFLTLSIRYEASQVYGRVDAINERPGGFAVFNQANFITGKGLQERSLSINGTESNVDCSSSEYRDLVMKSCTYYEISSVSLTSDDLRWMVQASYSSQNLMPIKVSARSGASFQIDFPLIEIQALVAKASELNPATNLRSLLQGTQSADEGGASQRPEPKQ